MATLEGGRISSRQFLALLVLTRLLAALIDAPTISGTSVEHDAWIAVIISTVMAVPWVLLLVHLSSMYPGMTIIQYSQVILGPYLGRLVGLMFVVFFLQQSAYTVRIGANAYTTTIMPETPQWVFIGLLTFLSANAARSGIEVLARSSSVSFAISLVLLVLLLVLPFNVMDFGNLFPVMARGWQPVQEATLLSFAIYGELLVMVMLVPYLAEPREAGRYIIYTLLLSGLLFTLFTMVVALVFGPFVSALIMPALSLGRIIHYPLVLERLEVIPLIAWTLSAGVKQCLFLWAAMLGIAQLFELSDLQGLAYPVGALIGVLSEWFFSDVVDASDFMTVQRFGTISFFVTVATPLFLYAMTFVRRLIQRATGKGR